MDALELLLNRFSCGRMVEPAPSLEQRQIMYKAAARAADHASLAPWRFLEIEGKGLAALGELMAQATQISNPDATESVLNSTRKKPYRAPMIVAAIACFSEHPKVPEWEQLITAGAAAQNMINAAFAQGVGAYWRTGSLVDSDPVRNGLGLQANEKLIGFIYLGSPALSDKEIPELDINKHIQSWPAN